MFAYTIQMHMFIRDNDDHSATLLYGAGLGLEVHIMDKYAALFRGMFVGCFGMGGMHCISGSAQCTKCTCGYISRECNFTMRIPIATTISA